MATPETRLQQQIQKTIYRNFKNAFVVKLHGNKFQKVGLPDLLIIIDGKAIFLETKVGKNKTSKVQDSVIKELQQSGAIAEVVYSLDEVKAVFKKHNIRRDNG
jgi:hypothetical protein